MKIRSLLVLPLLTGAMALGASPAHAESRVDVTNDRGGSEADLQYQTKLTIEGSGFQTVRGGFGGVYLMFGWVRDAAGGSWRPSQGGLTGEDYQYIPDSENAADNLGYLKFIAFPGSSTASEANAVLSDAGAFTVDLTVPGPVFQAVDRDGDVEEVDCREVTCGVITIGAHGVKNARNESFTPVAFGDVYDAAPAAPAAGTPSETPSAAAPTAPSVGASQAPAAPTPAAAAAPRAVGPAAVTVDRATAIAGRAMVFNAQGFTPGEQVVAVLDDGVAALGPMAAGASGEVAGVLQLPAELGVGTHELRITGAASGTEVSQRFPVSAAATPVASTTSGDDAAASSDGGGSGGAVFLVVAVVVFALALAGFVLARRRPRRPTAGGPVAPMVEATP